MERDLISPSIHPILSDKSSVDNEISATASPKFVTPAPILISRLSFSHIREIMLQLPDKTTLENFLLKELKEQKEE